ncbi:signal peptidase I [Terribacillus halophilus]|uniref:Signal peptidase I n=1 Tax=Terribacillus halophilus TaxID=361279 RepID=A0A1G6PD41_9BACI|nr:signal peptidase I [Terribacillus halophilus]SDC77918.1 signal peptidase I [Terribacillus halophilus]
MKNKIRWKFVFLLVGIVLVLFCSKELIFADYRVEGESMEPTLQDGNFLMVNKFMDDASSMQRFDVIVFHATEDEDYVKRIIGMPGDSLEVRNDRLFVNGEYRPEHYLEDYRDDVEGQLTCDFTLEDVTGRTTVPEGMLFVMGDNRRESLDSRSFGFIPIKRVVGKVGARFWPMSATGLGA